jgi:hypothetical protein
VVHLRRVVTTGMDGTKTVTYQTSFSKAQLNTNSYVGQIVIEMDFPAMEQDERFVICITVITCFFFIV